MNKKQFTEKDIEAVAKRAQELLRERTPEERAEGDALLNTESKAYMERSQQQRVSVGYATKARPKRFFGIGVWF